MKQKYYKTILRVNNDIFVCMHSNKRNIIARFD